MTIKQRQLGFLFAPFALAGCNPVETSSARIEIPATCFVSAHDIEVIDSQNQKIFVAPITTRLDSKRLASDIVNKWNSDFPMTSATQFNKVSGATLFVDTQTNTCGLRFDHSYRIDELESNYVVFIGGVRMNEP